MEIRNLHAQHLTPAAFCGSRGVQSGFEKPAYPGGCLKETVGIELLSNLPCNEHDSLAPSVAKAAGSFIAANGKGRYSRAGCAAIISQAA